MRQVINIFRRSYKIFLAVAAFMALQLILAGQIFLCGSILIGALLNFFYFISTAARLEAVMKMNQAQAKRVMLIGLVLRLLMVFVVLAVAVKISTQLFIASAGCLVVFYITSLGVLAYNERR